MISNEMYQPGGVRLGNFAIEIIALFPKFPNLADEVRELDGLPSPKYALVFGEVGIAPFRPRLLGKTGFPFTSNALDLTT